MYKYNFKVCRVWARLNDFGNKTLVREFSMVLHGLTLASDTEFGANASGHKLSWGEPTLCQHTADTPASEKVL